VVSKGADTSSSGSNNGEFGADIITVALPDDNRNSILLTLQMSGVTIWERTVPCSLGSYSVELRGTGSGTVDIFIDNEYMGSKTVDFNNG